MMAKDDLIISMLSDMKENVGGLKADVTSLKSDMATIKGEAKLAKILTAVLPTGMAVFYVIFQLVTGQPVDPNTLKALSAGQAFAGAEAAASQPAEVTVEATEP
jgi:hypothetical protein